ncbi:hypothetical protein SCUCBS95973_000708 [Sporothrix curviconia]|uniref:Extracelular serine carboxypeptidase n=1 Tax=Sporothrix curviconia TaxID=1260050 RepID=A0ABP0ASH3_9PEZI
MRFSAGAVAGLLLAALPTGSAGMRTWQPIRELQKQIQEDGGDGGDGGDGSGVLGETPRPSSPPPAYPAYNLSVPVDHFHNDSLYAPHTNDTFALRYWFDAQHYQPGGPVILLAAGETSGEHRLPFLQKGIAARLAQATNGLAVVLEHRYYGASFPYGNLSTDALRFLRTEQALADTAYFATHVAFPGLEGVDVTPGAGAPWIVYGGSYAGAFAAFARMLYPEVFWGAISSSGVTVAVYDYWQYYEAQRLFAPTACVHRTQELIHVADQILLAARDDSKGRGDAHRDYIGYADHVGQKPLHGDGPAARGRQLKEVFGLGSLTHDDDFAAVLSDAMGGWQETNWDPTQADPGFDWYCGNVTADTLLYPDLEDRRSTVRSLLQATSYNTPDAVAVLEGPMLNYIGWVRATHPCKGPGQSQDQCFSNRNATFYRQDDSAQRWRSWSYQYCTQWGYLATGSGVPHDRLPLVSRLLDLEYLSLICREAFGVTGLPDVASVNQFGGFGIHYPRLAIVDGEADPWRAATPHALGHNARRPSTTSEPFLLIPGAVHHWDEYGLYENETTVELPPQSIRDVQADEVDFVAQWVADWAGQNLEDDDGRM